MKTQELVNQDTRFTGKYASTIFQTLWFAYRPRRWILGFSLLMGLSGRLLILANANVIGIWVDTFCRSSESVRCRPIPGYFAAFQSSDFVQIMSILTGVGFLLTFTFRVLFSVASAKAVSQIYDETTFRTSRFPMSFFDNTPTGRIVTRFSSDYGNVFRLFGGPLAEFLSIVFDMFSMVVLIALASPLYLPAIVLVGICNFIVYRLNRDHLRAIRRELSASRSPSIAHFSETAQGASTIRSFSRQKSFSERFRRLDSHFLQQKKRVVKNISLFSFQMNSLTAVLLVLTGIMAFFLLQRGLASVGSLGVAFGFITLSGTTVQMFFEWLAQFEEAMIGVERLDNYIHKPLEPGARLPAEVKFMTPQWRMNAQEEVELRRPLSDKKALGIEFKDVWFRYGPDQPFVLKDVSFQVQPGERFGIIGRTGSGKSSLIQSLLYLYPIDKGLILIDGKKPQLSPQDKGVDLEAYRQAISFISQESILFKGTLRENLEISGTLSDEKILQTLHKVGLEEWSTPQDLQIRIDEKGKNLSLGEKQLICMARCLLQQSPVVIMDEATSSVDPRSEEIMVKATNEFFEGRTQIIIAHRLSTLQNCDRILWLQDGQTKMIGNAREVLKRFSET